MRALALLVLCTLLAACTSTESTLDPNAIVSPEPVGAASGAAVLGAAPPAAAAIGSPPSPANALARIQIAPVVGATLEAAAPLSQRLVARGREQRIEFAGENAAGVTHVIKGYFSASREGRETVVYYVWDVLDPAGNRLHRIFGQATAPGGRPDAWDNVEASTMEAIADQTVMELSNWLSAQLARG
jgi:hypothetical protein